MLIKEELLNTFIDPEPISKYSTEFDIFLKKYSTGGKYNHK